MRKLFLALVSVVAVPAIASASLVLPALNIDSLLAEDSINARSVSSSLFRSSSEGASFSPYRFAVSSDVQLSFLDLAERSSSPSGGAVLTYDIDAANAKLVTLYFSKFHLLEGDSLFIIGEDGSALGPFTSQQNSASGVLPTSMLECSKVRLVLKTDGRSSSARQLTIGKINQGYRSFRRVPYQNTSTNDNCSSYDLGKLSAVGQSVCIIIYTSGSTAYACSGALVNNTSGNAVPYVLTAAHCIDTEEKANTAVVFFNYQSPLGNSDIRGSMEFYCVSPEFRAAADDLDFSLLQLSSMPARDFRPYLAGWSRTDNPVVPAYVIHQPASTVKRLATTNRTLSTTTFTDKDKGTTLYKNGHWLVSRWDKGTTDSGSSGSPLFDSNLRIIGALSGGASTCSAPVNDLFYKFAMSWDTYSESSKQLKAWLDPAETDLTEIDGQNPYGSDSCQRLTNIASTDEFTSSFSAPASASMVAQGFTSGDGSYLYGVYLVSSTKYLPSKIYVFNDLSASPVYTHTVSTPSVAEWNTSTSSFKYSAKTGLSNADTYIRFDTPVPVGSNFYVAYPVSDGFVPYAAVAAAPGALAYADIEGTWSSLTDAGTEQNVVWIDAVVSPNSSRVSVDEAKASSSALSVYPNPVSRGDAFVNVHASADRLGQCRLVVYNLNSQNVLSLSSYSDSSDLRLDVSALRSGVYAVQIISEGGVFVGKLVVTE